jgi:hypothetical protein
MKNNFLDTFRKLDGEIRFAAYVLTLGPPIGQLSIGHVLHVVGVLIVDVIIIAKLLERILDQFFS